MPGVDLNLDLPTGADTMADIVAKIVTAIETIETDLAARITAGEMDITTELSMGGAPLTNVGGVRLVGGESTAIGTLYMDEELNAVTAAGVVQITSNGSLNVAALGTIGGDYGGANPAEVTYDDISGEYRFTEAPGEWADVVCQDVVLKGTAGSIRLNCNATVSGAKTVSFKTFPAAGISPMVFNQATSTIEDGAVTRPTNTALFTAINVSADATIAGGAVVTGNLTAAGLNHTTAFKVTMPAVNSSVNTGIGMSAGVPTSVVSNASLWHYYTLTFGAVGLREGDVITKVRIGWSGNAGATPINCSVYHNSVTFGTTSTVGTPSSATSGFIEIVPGASKNTLNTEGGELNTMWVYVSGQGTGVFLSSIDITYTHPA